MGFKIKNSKFLTISIKNSSQVIARVIIGILNIKLIAIFLGPSGMAIISQFQSFLQLSINLAGAGINNGIIKYVSEFQNNPKKLNLVISTSIIILLSCSLFISLINFLFSKQISFILFHNSDFSMIIHYSWIYIITTAAFNLILAINNGLQNLKTYILLNLIYFISSFTLIATTLYFFSFSTVLWVLLLQSSIAVLVAIITTTKQIPDIKLHFSKLIMKRLSKFSLMTITSATIPHLTTILIRNTIINTLSMTDTGVWEGVNKISTSYIGLATLPFSYYFIPTFAKLKKSEYIRREIRNSFKLLIPILIIGGILIYILRREIISLLLSNDFQNIANIIKWQLIGDIFHVLSWVIGILLITKEKSTTYILTELISGITLVILSSLFIKTLGLEGSTLAYFAEKTLSFIMLYIIYIRLWKK